MWEYRTLFLRIRAEGGARRRFPVWRNHRYRRISRGPERRAPAPSLSPLSYSAVATMTQFSFTGGTSPSTFPKCSSRMERSSLCEASRGTFERYSPRYASLMSSSVMTESSIILLPSPFSSRAFTSNGVPHRGQPLKFPRSTMPLGIVCPQGRAGASRNSSGMKR